MVNVKSDNVLLTTNTQVYNAIQGAYYKWAIQKAFNVIVSESSESILILLVSLKINRNLEKMRFCWILTLINNKVLFGLQFS